MECSIEVNRANCTCTYTSCSRRGRCCECLRSHWSHGELPGCLFPPEAERTYDRSLENFIRIYSKR